MKTGIEIKPIISNGYENIYIYDTWKVSMLSYLDELKKENIKYVEAHLETDEIFYLLSGECILIEALVSDNKVIDYNFIKLDKEQIYNVKKNTYHHHILSEDARVLIVENTNTSNLNSHRIEIDNREMNKKLKDFYEKMLSN